MLGDYPRRTIWDTPGETSSPSGLARMSTKLGQVQSRFTTHFVSFAGRKRAGFAAAAATT